MNAAFLSRLAALLLAATVGAQEMVWRKTGTPGARLIGYQIAAIGDINQDGCEDLLTIVSGACGAGTTDAFLWILSGVNGALLREVALPMPYDKFVSIGRAGDWNNDGVPDYVVAVGYTTLGLGIVEIRSGVNDLILHSVPTNAAEVVMADIDLDGDGLNDLIVADEHPYGYLGELRAFDHSGQLLYHLIGDLSATANPPLAIAVCAAKLGDVDDDGCDDFVMACYDLNWRGASVVVSGKTGDNLRVCYGELPGDLLCWSIDACGDVDGDGYQDFVVGNGAGTFPFRGVVQVFSSRTGQMLRQWLAPADSMFGWAVASRGVDFDGDSIPDVATGSFELMGRIYAYSGRDGATLHQWAPADLPKTPTSTAPYFIPATGLFAWKTTLQPPGQHTGWIIAAENLSDYGCAYPLGSVSAYRGAPRSTQFVGSPCAGNLPSAPNIGLRTLGTAGMRIPLSAAPPNVPALLLVGATWLGNPGVTLPFSLDTLGWPGCSLRTSVVLSYPVVTGSSGIDAGYAFVNLPWQLPLTGGNPANMLSAQWLVLGDSSTWPGGWSQGAKWFW